MSVRTCVTCNVRERERPIGINFSRELFLISEPSEV